MKNNTNYLTISELGRLRNVDSKSLRYYERVGALIPAYVDPDTQYRYYTVGQLIDLDTILLCLEMGIPLKEASKYREEDGTLAVKSLFEDGKRVMDDKVRKYEAIMARLQYQESQTELFQSHGVYEKLLTENVNIDSVIITNMALDTYRHDTFPIEVQI